MKLSLVEYKKGINISINDIGPQEGIPIIVNHGMIASIKNDDLFKMLVKNGRRIISMARPGYGQSSPYPLESVSEWGEIAKTIVQQLQIKQFDLLGFSSGAPYTYSIAHHLPERTRNVYIFSGIPALCDQQIASQWPYPLKREGTISEFQKLAKELFFSNVPMDENKNDDFLDSYANHCFGIALDLQIRCQPWGFDLSEIKSKVYMEHSINDLSVPFITAELTAKKLANCIFIKRTMGNHFSMELVEDFFKNVILRE